VELLHYSSAPSSHLTICEQAIFDLLTFWQSSRIKVIFFVTPAVGLARWPWLM